MQPTFIGIGVQKSATCWCWRALSEHPEIYMSQPKELDYFTDHYSRGREWYESFFSNTSTAIRGEISPLYIDSPEAPQRIFKQYPHVKLLVILRDPRQRAISNVLHDLRDIDGGISNATVERVAELARSNEGYLRRSSYYSQLQPFYSVMDPNVISILFYEDLKRDPVNFVKTLYTEVGANSSYIPKVLHTPEYKTMDYWSPALFKAIQSCSQAANSWGPTRAGMEWLYRRTKLRENMLQWLSEDRGKPQFDFLTLFGESADRMIDKEIDSLSTRLNITPPREWEQTTSIKQVA